MRALQRNGVGLKLGLGVLLVVVAFSLLWGLCGPSASATTSAYISGVVTEAATGSPVDGWATAYMQDGAVWDMRDWAYTDGSGNYEFDYLEPGTYIVKFSGSAALAEQYYNGKTTQGTADTITLSEGETRTGINGALLAGGSITGHLTDSVVGEPLIDSEEVVNLYIRSGSTWECWGFGWSTNESGVYDIDCLPAGDYILGFSAVGNDEVFYNGKTTQGTADSITLGVGETESGKDATVVGPAHIRGRLTDAATGLGLNGPATGGYAVAYAYYTDADDPGRWDQWGEQVRCNASGEYDIPGLAAGTYRVAFVATSGYESRSSEEFYNGKTTLASATGVTVGQGEVKTGINAVVSTAAPSITSVSATSGFTTGGNIVAINGANFSGATTVKFGGTPATAVTWVSRYRLTAKAPARAAGKVDVTAANAIGTSPTTGTGNDYKYYLRTEETSTNLRYAGAWTTSASTSLSGGAYKRAGSAGGAVAIRFTGNYLAWIATKASSMGIARVTLDYGTPIEVDLYRSATAYKQKVWETPATLATGTHTAIIEWTGKKNAASSATYINADAFDTLGVLSLAPLRYQENNPKVLYSTGWATTASPSASGGTYRYASAANAKATVKFTGTSIVWVGVKSANYGKATVTLDGVYKGTVDLYSASTKWASKLFAASVPSGNHTLVITCTGTRQTAATGTRVSTDAFDVLGALY